MLTAKEGNDIEAPQLAWTLHPHINKPCPSPAIEVFSVIIGRENWKEMNIYGSIEVSFDYGGFSVFKKNEGVTVRLLEGRKSLPMLNGSGVFEDCCSLKLECDLKDVCDSTLNIKGYVEWDAGVLSSSLFYDRHLCAVIQGESGFAALHYSIFLSAVQANLKVFYKPKKRLPETIDAPPSVWGSLLARCGKFEYLSQYSRDCYKTMLFERTEEDSIQIIGDGIVPLSRSVVVVVVVPSDSFLVIDADLTLYNQRLLCTRKFGIGTSFASVEFDEYDVYFEVEWSDIK
ncbi:unnamed protein product [Cuscuta europaea]|nr:unnamed protein product [Cuscuta europaea]